jgi:hypothetical protein
MPRRRVDRRRRPALDDAPEIHYRDAVAEMPDDAEVVRDEQHRQVELAAQAQEQIDDLRLDRHVERGDRLVADEEVGLHGERAGDGDALALPAGELVRIAADIVRIEPDRLEPCPRDLAGLLSFHEPVRQRPLEDGLADAHARVERRERVLEHGLDPRRQLAAVRRDRAAVEKHATLARHQDAGDDAAEGRLAAARLADEAERLAARDGERNLAHRLHGALFDGAAEAGGDAVAERQVRREALRDPLDRQEGVAHAASAGVRTSG